MWLYSSPLEAPMVVIGLSSLISSLISLPSWPRAASLQQSRFLRVILIFFTRSGPLEKIIKVGRSDPGHILARR